jgi:hypothetical protein
VNYSSSSSSKNNNSSHADSIKLRRISRAHQQEPALDEPAGSAEPGSRHGQRLSWFKGAAATTGAASSKSRRVSRNGIGAVELLGYQAGNKSYHDRAQLAEDYAQQELVLPSRAGEAGSTVLPRGPRDDFTPAQPTGGAAAVPSAPQRPRLKWFGKANRKPLPGAAVGDWPSMDKLRTAMPGPGSGEHKRKTTTVTATPRVRPQGQLDDVLTLAPGETGFGSMPGSLPCMTTKPSARDSLPGGLALPGMFEVENSHGSVARFAQGLRSSLAGAAAAVTNAFSYR